MGYRRGDNLDKNLVFAEYFNSEQEVRRNGGVPTVVTFDKGIATFNGANSYISYKIPINGTYSVRIILNHTDSVGAQDWVIDFQNVDGNGNGYVDLQAGTVFRSFGTIYVNGVASAAYTRNEITEIVVTGIIIDTWPPTSFRIGSQYDGTGSFQGTIELVEVYNKTLTADEVLNIYNNARYQSLDLTGSKILHVNAYDGVCRNLLAGWTIGGVAVPEVSSSNIEVMKEGIVNVPRFNGTTSKIDCGTYNYLVGDLTILAWINSDGEGENLYERIVDNGKLYFAFRQDIRRLILVSDYVTAKLSAVGSLEYSDYFCVCAIRKTDGSVTFYVDGELSGAADQDSGTPVAGTANITVGNTAATTATFDGKIPEVIVVSGILTVAEISQYYTSTKHLYNK